MFFVKILSFIFFTLVVPIYLAIKCFICNVIGLGIILIAFPTIIYSVSIVFGIINAKKNKKDSKTLNLFNKNNHKYNNEFKYIDGNKNAELSIDEINNIEEFLEDDDLFM